jgi:hypothetical protein
MMLSEVFWTFTISSSTAVIVLLIKSCVKANQNIDNLSFCFGLFRAHRVIRLDDIQVANGSDDENGSGSGGGSVRLTPTSGKPEVKI